MTRMHILQLPEPLTIISPHLDDAVFSCGALIAAAAADTVVVTVLAGMPDHDAPLTDWDSAAGFTSAAQAVANRRREDAHSLRLLGARPEWLGFLDGQYGKRHSAEDIMTGLAAAPGLQRGGTVLAPMGLFHSDHLLVAHACLLLRETLRELNATGTVGAPGEETAPASPALWLFYEDAIHRRVPGALQGRLMSWWQAGMIAKPVHFPEMSWLSAKMVAAQAYESQLPLFDGSQLADIGAPERYWSLDVPPLARCRRALTRPIRPRPAMIST